MSLEVCVNGEEKKNISKTKCTANIKLFKRAIETPKGWFLTPAQYATAAALKTALQDLLKNPKASRGYLFPPFAAAPEDNSEESIYETTPYGRQPVRDGQMRFKHALAVDLCTHKALQTHRMVNDGRILYQDVDNQLLLTEIDDTGNLYPLTLALLWTEKVKLSDGTNSTKSPFVVDLADNKEIDNYGVLIDGSVVNQLEMLTDVTIELTAGDAFSTTEFFVDVYQSCDKTPVSGLVLADFLFYAADGITEQTIASAVEDVNNPGRYHIVAPGGGSPNPFEDGTLTLVAPSELSIDAYEVDVPLVVNVP